MEQELERMNALNINRGAPAAVVLNEADVKTGGARRTPDHYATDGIVQSGLDQHSTVNADGMATAVDIELPYTVPSDGQRHNVAVRNHELPATYRYFAVPKRDKDVFLQAQITNWEALDLMPAPTNVYFENSYVGQGFIDMRNVKDTLNLSLGRDKKIIVRRERDRSFRSDRFIGTNEREAFAYTISLRNTRRESVNMTVLDQFPLSTDKDIVIEDREAPEAEQEAATGLLRWNLNLKPADLRKLRLSYSVRHPKGKLVSGLR
jgi:uncharacterized protein (TIGR02231 family)